MLPMSACQTETKSFPDISFEDDSTETSETSQASDSSGDNPVSNINEITAALPYSEETVSRLLKLFYIKSSGSMADNVDGASIELDYLDSVSIPWIGNVINVPSDGVNLE